MTVPEPCFDVQSFFHAVSPVRTDCIRKFSANEHAFAAVSGQC